MLEEAVEYVKFLQKQIQVLPAYFEILQVSKKIQADNEIMKLDNYHFILHNFSNPNIFFLLFPLF